MIAIPGKCGSIFKARRHSFLNLLALPTAGLGPSALRGSVSGFTQITMSSLALPQGLWGTREWRQARDGFRSFEHCIWLQLSPREYSPESAKTRSDASGFKSTMLSSHPGGNYWLHRGKEVTFGNVTNVIVSNNSRRESDLNVLLDKNH